MDILMTTLGSCGIVYCGSLCLLKNIPSMFLINECQVGSFLNFASVLTTVCSQNIPLRITFFYPTVGKFEIDNIEMI